MNHFLYLITVVEADSVEARVEGGREVGGGGGGGDPVETAAGAGLGERVCKREGEVGSGGGPGENVTSGPRGVRRNISNGWLDSYFLA